MTTWEVRQVCQSGSPEPELSLERPCAKLRNLDTIFLWRAIGRKVWEKEAQRVCEADEWTKGNDNSVVVSLCLSTLPGTFPPCALWFVCSDSLGLPVRSAKSVLCITHPPGGINPRNLKRTRQSAWPGVIFRRDG